MARAAQDMTVGGEQIGFATVQAAWPQSILPFVTAVMAWKLGSVYILSAETERAVQLPAPPCAEDAVFTLVK